MRAVIDRSGRVVIPKPVRDALRLVPGTTFEVVETANGIELQLPNRIPPTLVRKGQFLVAASRGSSVSDATVRELRDAGRR